MVAGVPSGTLKPMFKTLFRYSRCSSRHANGPLAQERSTFCRTFKLRASRAPLFCATQASCFWSLACCPEREGVRSRAAKSPVAPGAGRDVSGGEVAREPSSGRRSVLIKPLVPGARSWAGLKTHRRPKLAIRPNWVLGPLLCRQKDSRKAPPIITVGGFRASSNGLSNKRCPCAKSPWPWWMGS